MIRLTTENFDSFLATNLPVVVKFGAPWCGPCRLMKPTLERLAVEQAGQAEVFDVDVDQSPELSDRFTILSVPTTLVFLKGEVVKTLVGLLTLTQLTNYLTDLDSSAQA